MVKNSLAGQQGTKRESLNKPTSHVAPAASASRTGALPAPVNGAAPTSPRPAAGAMKMQNAATSDMKKATTMLMDEKRIQLLNTNISILDAFINHHYMAELSRCKVLPMEDTPADRSSICVYELTKLMLSDVEDTYEKLVSLYASLYGMRSTVGLIIDSDGTMVHVYLCTCCNDNAASAGLLKNSIMGHFPGSRLEELKDIARDRLMMGIQQMPGTAVHGVRKDKHIRTLSIVPSRREEEKSNNNIKLSAQGIEKFIDGMAGKQYTAILIAEPIEQGSIEYCKRGFESLFSLLSPFAKETVSYSENESDATNFSLSVNMSDSISEGISSSYGTSHTKGTSGGKGGNSGMSSNGNGFGFSSGSCWNSGWNTSDTTTTNVSDTKTKTKTKGDGETSGDSHTTGMSRTINVTREIKTVQNCMQRLEAEMQRIETNRSFGMWNCCCYVISDSAELTYMATSSLQSLFCGDAAYGGQSYANSWSCNARESDSKNLLTYLSYFRHPWLEYTAPEGSSLENQIVSPSMMVSGRDLPTLLSLPQRSVPGMQVMTMAEFGRNFPREFKPKRPLFFGNVMHMGNVEATQMVFDLDRFASHCFICGASGSGKSNTTYNLLDAFHCRKDEKGRPAPIPFLVIEPAKGEYKTEFAGMPGMQIFTCKPDGFRMLSINPFEFHKDVHIKEHLAHLNSVVSTCWPLYGPMPAMLKDAFEEAYISCGWDLELSQRIVKIGRKFPTFAEVLPAIEKIIDESTYSGEEKGNYKGALCMRIKMLMNGFEGQIFGNSVGIPDAELFDQSTIIDLSSLGNPETRSLIMGVLIVRLREYRFAQQAKNSSLNSEVKHITVLEEAHNILKRCSHESSQDSGNVQGASVGMLVDCIAEMRSCGEGFMIIDQSPGAVDEAALKNTAIKIVMRLPEKNDCEAIGGALSLREDQILELSRFDKGVAAVFHEGWEETVLGKMGTIWSKTPHAAAYRIIPTVVDRTELIRTKGAVCQWLCSKYIEDEMEELENMRAFDSFISTYKASKYAPSVNDNLWKDIRQQISQFLTEIKENIDGELGDLDVKDKVRFIEYLGQFLRRFLQIDGIFRLNTLKLTDYAAVNVKSPTNKQMHEVKQWWERMKSILSYYMILPVKCGIRPLHWTTDTLDGQYIEFIFKRIVKSYDDEYVRTHPGMSIYQCAYRLLDSTFLPDPKY